MGEIPEILIVHSGRDILSKTAVQLSARELLIDDSGVLPNVLVEITREKPRLLLLDMAISPEKIPHFCKQVKHSPMFVRMYVVLMGVSGFSSQEHQAAMKAGADDYCPCPEHLEELVSRMHLIERLRATEVTAPRTEERWRSFIENSPDHILILNGNLDITFANFASPGLTVEDLLQTSILDYLEDKDKPRIQRILKRVLENQKASYYETEYCIDNDTVLYYETIAAPLSSGPEAGSILMTSRDITERKKTELSLERSEKLFRKIFTLLPVGVWLADKDGKLLEGNPKGIEIWGGSPLVPQTEYDVFKARRLPSLKEVAPEDWALAHTVNEGVTISGELLEIDAFDGVTRTILNYTAPVLDDHDQIMAAIVVNLDITERIRAEKFLRESEEKYRKYVENAPEGIFIADGTGKYVEVNNAACRMTGYSRDELLSMSIPDLVSQHLPLQSMNSFEEVKQRGKTKTETVLQKKSGEDIYVALEAVALGNDRYMAFCSDITEKIAAREALKNERDRAQMYLDIAGVMFIALNEKGTVVLANRKATKVLEGRETDIIGKNWFEHFLLDDDKEQVFDVFLKLMNNEVEPVEYFENHVLTIKGRKRLISWHNAIRLDEQGKVIGILSSGEDITAQRKAEKEKEALSEQLTQSQKMEAIGRLAGGIAHDFNNTLTAIIGFAEILNESLNTSDPLRHDVDEILRAAQSASLLTQQLLGFSRKQIIAPRILNLNDVVSHSKKMLKRMIGEDVELDFMPQEDLPMVKFDEGQIEQILINLAVNARDAMPEGGKLSVVTRTVEITEADLDENPIPHSGQYVVLEVSDTGLGMDEKLQKCIFEPFFTTKTKGKGTGLGLSTVYGIVNQNNGFVAVNSKEGMGTTFHIYIPVADSPEVVSETKLTPSVVTGNETILVVEDQEIVLKLVTRILKKYGYSIISASNGGEALALCHEYQGDIDLMLTDVVMPGLSGKTIFDRIHQVRPTLKVLYMSGYTEDVIAHHGVLEEGVSFLHKPFRADELARKVRSILDSAQSSALAQTPRISAQSWIVLVIDDEEFMHELIGARLKPLGCTVFSKSTGKGGLEYFTSHRNIDLVILDMSLPDMWGTEVLQKIRLISPEVAVILASGFSADEIPGFQDNAVNVSFLQKPFGKKELLEAVKNALGIEKSGAS